MALKQIKNKITSTQKTGKVTKAMEAVSAVKMRKTQERALKGRPYVRTALSILSHVATAKEVTEHPLLAQPNGTKLLHVIVTSDKGLAGSVNSAVLKQAEQLHKNYTDIEVIAIGKKAVEFAHRNNISVRAEYTNITDEVTVSDVRAMKEEVMQAFSSGAYACVYVTYQNFVSTFEQKAVTRRVLPLDANELREIQADIAPKTGRYQETGEKENESNTLYTIEPGAEEVLQTLIPQLIEIMLYHALTESKACEHSARMVAMKNATDKTKEITKSLTLLYNKERQAVITAEVSEITGGIEALKE